MGFYKNGRAVPPLKHGNFLNMSKQQTETELIKTLRLIAECDPPFHAATKAWDVWDWQRARQQHIEVARAAIDLAIKERTERKAELLTDEQFRQKYEEANIGYWKEETK